METDWSKLKEMLLENDGSGGSGSVNPLTSEALVEIKNAIIGSNRQKDELMTNGLVPIILDLCTNSFHKNSSETQEDRLNALVILGSLTKGKEKQVQTLTQKYNILPVLIQEIFREHNDKKCVEICLRTMRSIYEHQNIPMEQIFSDVPALTYFLSLASPDSSLKTQVCVTRILVSVCKTHEDQARLLHAGTIHVLARMICSSDDQVQLGALHCLASMCHKNRSAADNVCVTSFQGRSMPDILTACLSRMLPAEVQLYAARCLTYIYRSGTLMAADYRILNRTLPSLARLCSEAFDPDTRGLAADTLAYLIEIDIELQSTAAISSNLLKSLFQLVKYHPTASKHAALRCYASLAANDEPIRKRIMDSNAGLIHTVLEGLNDCDKEIRLGAVRCLHSLSRSLQQLRTTFQDHKVWKPLMALICSPQPDDILIALSSTFCNLLLEFSPCKEILLTSGIIRQMRILSRHEDSALRLNSVWALMNMSFKGDQDLKSSILSEMGTKFLIDMVYDKNPSIVLKTLGLLRNICHNSYHIDFVMATYCNELFEAVVMILESQHTNDIKEQALCIVGNVAAEAKSADYIVYNEPLMIHLGNLLFQSDFKLQSGAVFALNNVVQRIDFSNAKKYLKHMQTIDVTKMVKEVSRKGMRSKPNESYIYRTLSKILIQMKKVYPEMATK